MTNSDRAQEPVPLVIVQGFLGTSGEWLWGNFERYLNRDFCGRAQRRTIFVSVGPVSSLHDRACELYYALLGGTVDYGAEHSTTHKHARYGRKITQGLYPEWSPTQPLHFLGHSIGGPTIIKLQSLIKQGHFGPNTHSKMILSVNAISAPFRGTQAVYVLGERPDAAPAVRPLSFGSVVGKAVHILSFISPLLPYGAFDMHGDCRSLTYLDISFISLLKQLWKSDWAESRDATPFDATFQAADERESNAEGVVDPETYYQSHVATMTLRRQRSETFKTHTPSIRHATSPLMYISARLLGAFDYSTLQPPPSFIRQLNAEMGDEYWANDGVVPVFSQWHPLPCW
ncbi:Alpha/Beta hydrolase protein [Mycena epipterygia]|nr:Alpha/Beta hydrolase protein [Mycena epipterygia]